MKHPPSVYLALACALLAGNANPAVTVNFIHPENYTGNFAYYGYYGRHDFGNFGRQRVMEDLHKHFNKLGAALPAGQDLMVEILDIHLANTGWPAITVRYSLQSQGNVLKRGEEHIKDMVPRCDRVPWGEILCAEKQMLNNWFDKTLNGGKGWG